MALGIRFHIILFILLAIHVVRLISLFRFSRVLFVLFFFFIILIEINSLIFTHFVKKKKIYINVRAEKSLVDQTIYCNVHAKYSSIFLHFNLIFFFFDQLKTWKPKLHEAFR